MFPGSGGQGGVLVSGWNIPKGLAELPNGPRTPKPGTSQPLFHSRVRSCNTELY